MIIFLGEDCSKNRKRLYNVIQINKNERGMKMEKLLTLAAKTLANITYSSAVAGASTASTKGLCQPKTPKALLK